MVRKLPYGISNFAELPKRNYFFADKTPFLHKLEDLGEKYIFFMRPRRFGKSLWVSLLQHYYGVQYKERFQELFGKYYVGEIPTENANSYLILRFDFSGIDTSTAEKTYQGFLSNVISGVSAFFADYSTYFTKAQQTYILSQTAPEQLLKRLFDTLRETRITNTVYLLIDEYDHFANELLALNLPHFREIVGQNGWVRKFYETIKTATGEGVVERIFVTGVSPATLDSMTSGFNIAKNLTRNTHFHEMFGFTEKEVMELIENVGVTPENRDYTMAQMQAWYDGFKLANEAKTHIYNPDMVLFFGSEYMLNGGFPDKMLDENIATDYGKIRAIFKINNEEHLRVQVLKELLENGEVTTEIVGRFNFEIEFGQREFLSLLFYMGMLSIESEEFGREKLRIPNYVMKELYYQYFWQLLRESELAPVSLDAVANVVYQMAKYQDLEPLKNLVNDILSEHSIRDSPPLSPHWGDERGGEKHLKTLFITLFYISNIYVVDSEPETRQKYMDVLLLGRRQYNIPHDFLFELKYIKKPTKKQLTELGGEKVWLEQIRQDTIHQLNTYRNTPKCQNLDRLRSYILIVVNMKIAILEQIP